MATALRRRASPAPSRRYRRKKLQRRESPCARRITAEVKGTLRVRGGTDGLDRFEAYAFETAASVLKDRARRRKVRHSAQHVELIPETHPTTDPGPDDTLAGREALRATAMALGELPERTRTILLLRRLERLSYGEIARRLGVSVSAIEKHMLRATEHLIRKAGDIR
jgi:RNA polymerase sigma-70 factor (ECF subfamily)